MDSGMGLENHKLHNVREQVQDCILSAYTENEPALLSTLVSAYVIWLIALA